MPSSDHQNQETLSEPRLYNSRIISLYLNLIRSRYSYIDVIELLAFADMKPYEAKDDGHWFTQSQVNRFYERVVQLTGNPNIAREAGRYGASPDSMGLVRNFVLGMLDLSTAYYMIKRATPHFTKSTIYKTKKLAPNKVEIEVVPEPGVQEEAFQCENRLGFFEAVGELLANAVPHIEHPQCMFTGSKTCKYIISWPKTYSVLWKRVRNIAVAVACTLFPPMAYFYPGLAVRYYLPMGLIAILSLALVTEILQKREVKPSLDNIRFSTEELLDQININYNNVLLSNEIGHIISKQTDIHSILTSLVQVLQKRLDFDRGLLLLADKDQEELLLQAGFGYNQNQLELLRNIPFYLRKDSNKGVFSLAFNEQKPFLVNDIDNIEEKEVNRSFLFLKKLGVQSCICCPIICEDKSIGVLLVDNYKSKRSLVQNDLNLLLGITPVIGVSIRNAERLENTFTQFNSTIRVLGASIESRDPLTAGHSEKVTEYVLGICNEMGLSDDFRKMIKVAALLHDYGKIGVPDSILKKQGRLNKDEYEIVKTHSAKTKEILEQINFEGIYRQVPVIAGAHHEKLDGSGYPDGLKGDEIPLGSKIIAVADFFEAITAERHYREPMPLKEAIRLLEEESGVHFDEKIVRALMNYYDKVSGNAIEKIRRKWPQKTRFWALSQVKASNTASRILARTRSNWSLSPPPTRVTLETRGNSFQDTRDC